MIDKKEITIYRQYVKKGKMEGHTKETESFLYFKTNIKRER
jgi:hypothetical protein